MKITNDQNRKERILVRRSRVIDLYCQGMTEREMSQALDIPRSTIGKDIRVMRQQARINVQTFIDERLPFEHETLMVGIRKVLKRSWDIVNDEQSSEKAKANILHVIMECYNFKRQLLVDVANIAPVIRDFIEDQEQEKQKQAQMEEYSRRQAVFGPKMENGNAQF